MGIRSLWRSELNRFMRRAGLGSGAPLLFCHIAKCGGTSFRAVIEAEYRKRHRLFWYLEHTGDINAEMGKFVADFQRRRHCIQIVYGHFSFGLHVRLDTAPYYATILREPVARVVSVYQHLARNPGDPLHSLVNTGMPIRQFVGEHHSEMTNNHMTRILAGVPAEPGKVVDDESVLQRAKENIERHFVVVGTMENMDRVVKRLGEQFCWHRHTIPHLNVMAQPRAGLDAETRSVIRQHNQLDIALYEWVKAREGGMVASRR